MKRISLLIILSVVIKATCADVRAPDERVAVSKIRTAIKAQCDREMELKLRQQQPDNAPAMSRWLTSYLNTSSPSEFCTCASQEIERLLAPREFWSGTPQQLAPLVRLSGARCSLPKRKSTFPNFCQDMLAESVGHPINGLKAQSAVSKFCDCVRSDIDSITPENFEAFTASTLKDFQAFRTTRQIPSDSTSLLGSMKRCGGEALGKELSDDI